MYAENEILFPPHAINKIRKARGEKWQELVDGVVSLPQDHPRSLALSLTMIRLDGCLTCETDSYRAMRGCVPCALQSLRRFKGSDQELLTRYQKAYNDVKAYLQEAELEESAKSGVPARAA